MTPASVCAGSTPRWRADGSRRCVNPIRIDLARPAGERAFDGILHRHDGLTILELEPRGEDDRSSQRLFRSIRARHPPAAGGRPTCARPARSPPARCGGITGFDRVKIYRFAADWSGRVIAEDRVGTHPVAARLPFPGLRHPGRSRARCTPPTRSASFPISAIRRRRCVPDRNPVTGGPIDLSFAVLRSVSPMHIEYMVEHGGATAPCRCRSCATGGCGA